ncbi:MAG: HNH endonuclease [Dehalococcoidia bacterium]|nr:HNH endonuclease [Dehalococcoidia bacterium]
MQVSCSDTKGGICMANSLYLKRLSQPERDDLRDKLHATQSGVCYICEEPIDLEVHSGNLDMDHIEPLTAGGRDNDTNLALTHSSCNKSKGASDLRIARCLTKFRKLDESARESGNAGANLGDVLSLFNGGNARLKLAERNGGVDFSFAAAGDNTIQHSPIYEDKLSGLRYFFAKVPISYVHHDDRINPRVIGSNIRGLLEEFLKKRPQLHVGLAWWAADDSGTGSLKLFDGQHKAAAQLLLGVRELPVRVFIDPPLEVLTQTNANAGSTLRQVAFDMAVMRNLGSTLYSDRLQQYKEAYNLEEDDYSFSEDDIVRHFRGEKRQVARYILDAQRTRIARYPDNQLFDFVEMSGRNTDKPMSYSTVNGAFFPYLYKNPLRTPIGQAEERELESRQAVHLMNIFASIFFVDNWDFDIGGSRIETKVRNGDAIPDGHLRAWRVSRDEVAANVVKWVFLVVKNYFAYNGKMVRDDALLMEEFSDELWGNIERFLVSLSKFPFWSDHTLSQSVFGPKQNAGFWDEVFRSGNTPAGLEILTKGLQLNEMITPE